MYEYEQEIADLKALGRGLAWAAAYLLVAAAFLMPLWVPAGWILR